MNSFWRAENFNKMKKSSSCLVIGMLIFIIAEISELIHCSAAFPAAFIHQIQSWSRRQKSTSADELRQRSLRSDRVWESRQIFVYGQVESRAAWQILSRVFGWNRWLYESEWRDASRSTAQRFPTLRSHKSTPKRCQPQSQFANPSTDKSRRHGVGSASRQWLVNFSTQRFNLRAAWICTEKHTRLSEWWNSTATDDGFARPRKAWQYSANLFWSRSQILAPSTALSRRAVVS